MTFALADNLATFLCTMALPGEMAHWSLTTLRETRVKIGATSPSRGLHAGARRAQCGGVTDQDRTAVGMHPGAAVRPEGA
jgi:hypothetical protein